MIVGVDPGLCGALTFMHINGNIEFIADMPVLSLTRGGKNKNEVDADQLACVLRTYCPEHAFVELVNAMPAFGTKDGKKRRQGVVSMFSFGRSAGIVTGVLAGLQIPRTLVPPQTWKKVLRVPASKDGARSRASELIPAGASYWTRVKDDGRAEASLIALHGLREIQLNQLEK